ncbi:MAG: hypothetical protein A2252_02955 [Elusimicrobia bacterium RIFOXYA2_FULL_39_19]|nr:MAG: hypothetical protein A2252_02955 [Elusimicrobia bacterium RIFOXYA2_FULL_39_19]
MQSNYFKTFIERKPGIDFRKIIFDLSYFENINRPLLIHYTDLDCDEHINNLKVNVLNDWNNMNSNRLSPLSTIYLSFFQERLDGCNNVLVSVNKYINKIEQDINKPWYLL